MHNNHSSLSNVKTTKEASLIIFVALCLVSVSGRVRLLSINIIKPFHLLIGSSIFYNTVGNLSDKYYLDITPAGWAFSIWGVIYIWLGISVVFCKYFHSTDSIKINRPGYNIRMHWTNFWQSTVHIQQSFLEKLL